MIEEKKIYVMIAILVILLELQKAIDLEQCLLFSDVDTGFSTMV